MDLTSYRTFGRSGLVVSPLALGTMTFGAAGWGAAEEQARAIFETYVEAGGNFLDTADVYSGGRSEELLGRFMAPKGLRDRLVVATKSGFGTGDHPHSGGNGAKHVHAAIDGSLRRLGTDYIDLYWAHVWDQVTPPEEVLQTMAALIRAGKVRYWGLSNAPAWYVARVVTLAEGQGLPSPIAVQLAYSLIERNIEHELIPAARALRLSVQPWSPLGGGFLSGKYRRDDPANRAGQRPPQLPDTAGEGSGTGDGRLSGPNPFGDTLFTERNWRVLDALTALAQELGRTPAEVALAWLIQRPQVDAVLIGASRVEQVAASVAALEVALDAAQLAKLEAASAPEPIYPYAIFSGDVRRMTFGGAQVSGWGERA